MSFSAREAALKRTHQRFNTRRLLRIVFTLSCRRFRLSAAAIAFFLFTFLSLPARAAVVIEPRVGFHGVFQLGRPFPLEIALSNSGRPAEGILEVRVWKGGATKGGAPYMVKYQREIFLGAQTHKTVQLTVDPDFISRPLGIIFSSSAASAAQELDLRRYFSPAPVLLFLSESGALPPFAVSAAPQSRLVSLAPAQLAADSRALLGVSHVILYEQSLRELSRAQVLALDTWLTTGGEMLIIGSLNYALYQEPALGRFLPVRVTGAKQINFVPGAGKGERVTSIAGAWTQTATLVNGHALVEGAGLPLIVEASRGRGRIVYLALDVGRPPLSQWNGLPRFLQNLIAAHGADEALPRTEWNDAVFNQLIASPSFIATYVPSGSMLLALVVYLAAVFALTWFWQRRYLSARRLGIVFLLLVSFGSAGGYIHFSRGGQIPDGVLLSSTVLESSGDGFVDSQANLALFSTQQRRYDLEMERGWLELTPISLRPRETAEPAVVRQDGAGSSRFEMPLREWDYRLFRMRRIDRFPLRAEFGTEGEQLVVKVDNRSTKDLSNCWLLLPGQRFDLGALPRGASWRKKFPLAPAKAADDPAPSRLETLSFREVTFPDKTRDVLFHSSMFARDGDPRLTTGAAVFFGWVKDPEPRVRIDDPRIQSQDYALFRAVYPLPGGEDE